MLNSLTGGLMVLNDIEAEMERAAPGVMFGMTLNQLCCWRVLYPSVMSIF